jgi:hypothetical protein
MQLVREHEREAMRGNMAGGEKALVVSHPEPRL